MLSQITSLILTGLNGRSNNSLIVRYLLATLVIGSHTHYFLGLAEPTVYWGYRQSYGSLAVNGFFFLSGLLVTHSFINRSPEQYVLARALRILPAWFAALALAVLLAVFFSPQKSWSCTTEHMLFVARNVLPLKVFSGGNLCAWASNEITLYQTNSPAWTIPFEVFCYVFVTPLFFIRNVFTSPVQVLLFLLAGIFCLGNLGFYDSEATNLSLFRNILFYMIGVSARRALDGDRLDVVALFCIITVSVLSSGSVSLYFFDIILITLIVLLVFYLPTIPTPKADLSYGLYIYAWPVQQAVSAQGVSTFAMHFSLTMFITGFLAWLSWCHLEKWALSFKGN